jgi:hypothetical protein
MKLKCSAKALTLAQSQQHTMATMFSVSEIKVERLKHALARLKNGKFKIVQACKICQLTRRPGLQCPFSAFSVTFEVGS